MFAAVLLVFVGRLVQVQGVQASGYAEAAQSVRLRTVTLPAVRGTITDHSGQPLAESVDARLVTADPMLVSDPAQYAHLLSPYLKIDEPTLTAKLGARPKRWVWLARNVAPDTWRQLTQITDPGTGLPLEGIFSEPQSTRIYPADQVAANVLGFLGADGHGAGGIEREFDSILAGRDGRLTYERDQSGRRITTAGADQRSPVPGRDLQLTIDRDVQWVAQQEIAAKVTESKAESGTVVVMNARTGAILAMATAPTFDPNNPGKAKDADRGNRPLSEIYEPGSIAKVVTMSALIDQGAATPATKVTIPGTLPRGGHVIHDDVGHGTWHLTLAGVLAKSSNIGTVLASEQIDAATLYSYQRKFGLAQPTGLRFPGESRGILAKPENWSVHQRAIVAFGQGLSLNAVQAAGIYATIANGGVRVAPQLVKGWADKDGKFHAAPPPPRTRVMSPRAAQQVTAMMEQVTQPGGTAAHVKIPGYRLAGKTGTAQRVDPSCRCYRGYTASFAGFAPADDPEIVVSVTLQNPVNGHFGGMLGGPVFEKVMTFALKSLGLPPTGSKPVRLPIEW